MFDRIKKWFRTEKEAPSPAPAPAAPEKAPEPRPRTVNPNLDADNLAEFNATRKPSQLKGLCHAPFKNIYFGHYGRAVACCYNRQYILGVYPEQSVKDIWFGEAAEKLRNAMFEDNLSLGCQLCEKHLNGGNLDGVKIKNYDDHPHNSNHYPSVMEFELSNVCNLECVMCNGDFSHLIRKNKEKKAPIPIPYDSAFVEQLREFIPHLHTAKFYGGEPFLVDIYYEIWDLMLELNPNIKISIQTNATVYNNRVKKLLERANIHLNLSIDSFVKETYEGIRVNARYEKVMENIEAFSTHSKARDTFFGISACVMRQNWRELPEIVKRTNELGAQLYFHTVWFPPQSSLWNYSSQELKDIQATLLSHHEELPDATALEVKNKTHYKHTVTMLSDWIEKATQRESEAVQHYDFKEESARLFTKIKEHLASLDIPEAEQKQRFNQIEATFRTLWADFPEKKLGFLVARGNEIPVSILLREMEVNDLDRIKSQAQAYLEMEPADTKPRVDPYLDL